ncbi:MAG TPA: hypothetical protein VFX30_00185 [bacterium]|nr:hypothetical protein [bacterium]
MFSQILPAALTNILSAGTANLASHAVEASQNLNALRPDPSSLARSTVLGLTAQTGIATLASLAERAALRAIDFDASSASPDIGAATASAALTLGLVHCAGWMEESAVTWLLRQGHFNDPQKRDRLTPAGQALRFALHHGLQFGAFLLGLSIAGGSGFAGEGLGLAGQALVASVSWDAGKRLGRLLFPKTFAKRDQRLSKARELTVYNKQPPLKLGGGGMELQRWQSLAKRIGDRVLGPKEALEVHQSTGRLRFVQRGAREGGLKGFVLYAADTRALGEPVFTEAERQGPYLERLRTLTDPVERDRKLTNWMEIKRSLWTFLTGRPPAETGDWDPLEIEIFPDPKTQLAGFRLSQRLQDLQLSQGIGDIRLTFTDDGFLAAGLLTFRSLHDRSDVAGIGIDLADNRRWWRHEEGWWPMGNPKMYYPDDLYVSLFRDAGRPTAQEMAARHAVSEALFKALWPLHPEPRHGFSMYSEFDHIPLRSLWTGVAVSGGMKEGLERLGAAEAQVLVEEDGPMTLSFAVLRRKR